MQPIEDDAYDWRTLAHRRTIIDEPDPELDFSRNMFAEEMGLNYDHARDILEAMLERGEVTMRVIRRQNWYRFV